MLKSSNFYICTYCQTVNDPLQHRCKRCQRTLFHTEYATKRAKQKHSLLTFVTIFSAAAIGVIIVANLPASHAALVDFNHSVTMDTEKQEQNTYTRPDGSTYTGALQNDQPHGQGELQWADGTTYRGTFIAGEITGNGVMEWTNGQKYEGQFLNGKPHGQGTIYFANGGYYKGEFINGKADHAIFNSPRFEK